MLEIPEPYDGRGGRPHSRYISVKIRIANLPADVSQDDIRELLDSSDDIRSVELVAEGDADNAVAVVDMDGDAAGEGAIRLLNGRSWRNTVLRVDKLLY